MAAHRWTPALAGVIASLLAHPSQASSRSAFALTLRDYFKTTQLNPFLKENRKGDSCLDRARSDEPRCCDGDSIFCTSPSGRCFCDSSCKLYKDCCEDYARTCELEFTKYGGIEVGFSYYADNWYEASRACEQHGGSLVTIKGPSLHKFLIRELQTRRNKMQDYWIGLNDIDAEGIWKWPDRGDADGYMPWANRQPETRNQFKADREDCVVLSARKKFQWNDMKCRAKRKFICQRKVYNSNGATQQQGIAKISGKPHFYTFDKNLVNFEGHCTYIMTQLCGKHQNDPNLTPFFVTVETEELPHGGTGFKHVTVNIGSPSGEVSTTLTVAKDKVPKVNGRRVTLPFHNQKSDNQIEIVGDYLRIHTNWGLEVYFNGAENIEIHLPARYWDSVCGLLGNFNGDPSDDRTDENGKSFESVRQFGDYWKAHEGCPITQYDPALDPCDADHLQLVYRYCGDLVEKVDRKNPFHECLQKLDGSAFFEMCAHDICTQDNVFGVQCPHFEGLARECARNDIPVVWRHEEFCPMECPENSDFMECGAPCPKTCSDRATFSNCDEVCAEGCFCRPGFVWQGNECVAENACGCLDNSGVYHGQNTTLISPDCQSACHCGQSGGSMACHEHSCEDDKLCKFDSDTETGACVAKSEMAESLHCLGNTAQVAISQSAEFFQLNRMGSQSFTNVPVAPPVAGSDIMARAFTGVSANPAYVKPDKCCVNLPYHSSNQGCCGGKLFDLWEEICCTGGWISTHSSGCQ